MSARRCWLVVVAAVAACDGGSAGSLAAAAIPVEPAPAGRRVLRVCADPNHLPFSNRRGEGFENHLAALVAAELDADLAYVWRPQRRGFLRTGVNAGACDLVIGLPTEVDLALTTRPYYRSTYAIVQPAGTPAIASLDDPALARLRIGVQIVGDDYANSPPVHALTRRGLARNLVGYSVFGDYGEDSPLAEVVRAVATGEVDVAVAWGPVAGYFAGRSAVPLTIAPVTGGAAADPPMGFDISMAVGRDAAALRDEVDRVLAARRDAVLAILRDHGVPHD